MRAHRNLNEYERCRRALKSAYLSRDAKQLGRIYQIKSFILKRRFSILFTGVRPHFNRLMDYIFRYCIIVYYIKYCEAGIFNIDKINNPEIQEFPLLVQALANI